MMAMFKPEKTVNRCPVCGESLQQEIMDQFGVPVGYYSWCPACGHYSDIWVNGLREVQCGQWNSENYESGYGAMSAAEKWQETKILWELNLRLAMEKLKYTAGQLLQPYSGGKPVHA